MTELEWKLSKENAVLKAQLAQVQVQLCQLNFNEAQKASIGLGEAWTGEVHQQAVSEEHSIQGNGKG